MKKIHENLTVQKRNILNELHSNSMTLQELRFFSIYLAKIDSKNTDTRTVRFPVEDFQRIMELGRMNIKHFKEKTDDLLGKKVSIPLESGGYKTFVLFEECKVDKDENDQWYVEISASNSALPYMFNFKNQFFQYKLWNALSLKSVNQIRMYEILKQYEKVGKKEFYIEELKSLLGIEKEEYTSRNGLNDFKRFVLESCKQALKANTDICYTYEKGKTGKGGKWLSIIFHIEQNTEYKDKLSLSEFIDLQPQADIIETTIAEEPKADNTPKKIDLSRMAKSVLHSDDEEQAQELINFCEMKLDLAIQKGTKIKSKTDYLIKIMQNNVDDFLNNQKENEKRAKKEQDTKQSYDINEFEKYAINYREIQQANGETAESDIIKDNDTIPEITDMTLNEARKSDTTEKTIIRKSEIPSELWERLSKIPNDNIEYIDDTQ